MNLANARFRQPEDFGNFPQVQIFAVIQGQNFPLNFGKLFEAVQDHLL